MPNHLAISVCSRHKQHFKKDYFVGYYYFHPGVHDPKVLKTQHNVSVLKYAIKFRWADLRRLLSK